MAYIISEFQNSIGSITFDHFETRNALSEGLIDELIDALHGLRKRKVRAVILRAEPGAKV